MRRDAPRCEACEAAGREQMRERRSTPPLRTRHTPPAPPTPPPHTASPPARHTRTSSELRQRSSRRQHSAQTTRPPPRPRRRLRHRLRHRSLCLRLPRPRRRTSPRRRRRAGSSGARRSERASGRCAHAPPPPVAGWPSPGAAAPSQECRIIARRAWDAPRETTSLSACEMREGEVGAPVPVLDAQPRDRERMIFCACRARAVSHLVSHAPPADGSPHNSRVMFNDAYSTSTVSHAWRKGGHRQLSEQRHRPQEAPGGSR